MQEYIQWCIENWEVFPAIIGAFAAVAAVTPNESDNKIADILLKAINLFGANIGNAKNK